MALNYDCDEVVTGCSYSGKMLLKATYSWNLSFNWASHVRNVSLIRLHATLYQSSLNGWLRLTRNSVSAFISGD